MRRLGQDFTRVLSSSLFEFRLDERRVSCYTWWKFRVPFTSSFQFKRQRTMKLRLELMRVPSSSLFEFRLDSRWWSCYTWCEFWHHIGIQLIPNRIFLLSLLDLMRVPNSSFCLKFRVQEIKDDEAETGVYASSDLTSKRNSIDFDSNLIAGLNANFSIIRY